MTTRLLAPRLPGGAARSWELELDAELRPSAAALTAERASVIAHLLAQALGVRDVAVRPHCGGCFVRARMAVEAHDLTDAVDRAAALLRSSAAATDAGPLVLVAARSSSHLTS
jgi:hypothetical protein